MEVTKELKEQLNTVIFDEVDKDEEGVNIEAIVNAVVGVLESHKVEVVDMAGKKRVPVMYVGKRDSYTDGLFSTGLWRKGDVKLVSVTTANQMFEHKDVYVPGKEDDSIDVVDIDEEKEQADKEKERLEETRNLVQQMTRKATVENFVAENYNGLKIPAEFAKLDEMKQFATQQIDRYGII